MFHHYDICSSEGALAAFPDVLRQPYPVGGMGLIVCRGGAFSLLLDGSRLDAAAGQTLFVSGGTRIQVVEESADLSVHFLFYSVEPIRDILGNQVMAMYLYSQMDPDPCRLWQTGEEDDIVGYMTQLDSTLRHPDPFRLTERKLLLLALTHRVCSIYSRRMLGCHGSVAHRNELFLKLIQLIEEHYVRERGVEFYADRLCLSPKYLSALCKSICGYTVQELVFKAIVRKSIALLNNTQKNVQEISDYFNFPNASYFGTFFKKQTGMSPQNYRRSNSE